MLHEGRVFAPRRGLAAPRRQRRRQGTPGGGREPLHDVGGQVTQRPTRAAEAIWGGDGMMVGYGWEGLESRDLLIGNVDVIGR